MTISRRSFLVSCSATGGGILIGLRFIRPVRAKQSANPPRDPFDAWVHIQSDGQTEIVLTKTEMGQGVFTALPMIIAEEAEIDWSRISVKQSDESEGTGGSGSVLKNYIPFRQIGAVVREAMIAAAAREWNVSNAECRAINSQVLHPPSGRSIPYAGLLRNVQQSPLPDPQTIRLKSPKNFTLIGRSLPHLDIPGKVSGKACFGTDVRLPGMVYAVVAQCPTLDGTLIRFDSYRAKAVPGVLDVFEIPNPNTGRDVAVVAANTWAAMQGRNALDLEWRPGKHANESTDVLTADMRNALDAPSYWNWSNSNLDPNSVSAAARIESVYEFPFLAHCSLEPMNATVRIKEGKCEVWAPTQTGTGTRQFIAQSLGLPEEKVTVHVTFVGGGFGRRFTGDYERQAALIAQKLKSPVKLMWTREDDFTHDAYRPAGMHRLRGGLDEQGNIVAWSHRIADTYIIQDHLQEFEMAGAVEIPYPVQHFQVSYAPVASAVPRGAWRSVAPSFNGFAVECFVDELAHAAKQDPYTFRRRLLSNAPVPYPGQAKRPGADCPQPDPRALTTLLDFVTEKANWGKPLGPNRGRGLAIWQLHGTYLAQVAEVTVEGSHIRVDRIITALDCGQAINPNGVTAQIEGGTLFALSAALNERITVKDGRIQQQNFDAYQLLRLPDAPHLETYLVSSDRPPGGIGEAAMPGPPASVANAVFAATGKRLRKLPFRLAEVTA
jgi:isoquinoline 1-oxidoreductase beta subunit